MWDTVSSVAPTQKCPGLRGFGEEVGVAYMGVLCLRFGKTKGSHVKTGSLVRRPEGMKT